MEPIRHGDVMLQPTSLPKEATNIYQGTIFTVQEGETTGHKHVVTGTDFTVSELKGIRYFTFPFDVTITHEEHKPLVIKKGTYKQTQEREKDWFSLSVRQVID